MKQYIVHFNNNRAGNAEEWNYAFSSETKMIVEGNIQWLVVCAINEDEAMVIANNLIDSFRDNARA